MQQREVGDGRPRPDAGARSTGLVIQLLGRPRLEIDGADGYRYRSRKSWAVLAFLLLGERPPTRSRLASLLFAEADDPLRALRWSLAEIRRGLGPGAALDGDPVRLTLPVGTTVDVDVLVHGHWREAVDLPGLGADLLDGFGIQNAAPFESWLLAQRRRLAAAAESILHEAALGHLARGELDRARDLALRATVMSPLDENHQALLIRLYRLAGDDTAAERQFAAWSETAERELGAPPGAAVRLALRERRRSERAVDATAIHAIIEAGAAAVSAGAVDAGVTSFETAVRLADQADAQSLRVETRLVLAEALIHTLGGLDEEGVATLVEAERIALAHGDPEAAASARAELGYVDFLRARYDRAERWFGQVLEQGSSSPSTLAKAMTYLGSVASDRAEYPRATSLLEQATAPLPLRARAAPRGLRPVDARARQPPPRLARRGRRTARRAPWSWPSASTGSRSCPGRRRCSARCGCPRATWPAPPTASSSRSPVPARSATRAGRGSRPAGWRWSPRPRVRSTGRSPPSSTHGRGPPGWPIRTCGSTSTSSMPCASWVDATATRPRRGGWRRCATGLPGRACGS